MKLLKQVSDRKRDKDGKSFVDLYLAWTYNNRPYCVRVRPQFFADYDKMVATATEVPPGELIEKYL